MILRAALKGRRLVIVTSDAGQIGAGEPRGVPALVNIRACVGSGRGRRRAATALKQGLGWMEGKSDFTITLRLMDRAGAENASKGRDWWDITPGPDFTEARAALELTLMGRDGHAYQALPIEATGVGTSELAAGQGLLVDCQKKLEKLFDKWLNDWAL